MSVIIIVIGVFFVLQQEIPQKWAKEKVVRSLNKELNAKIMIKSFSFKFPNMIILKKIEIYQQNKKTTSDNKPSVLRPVILAKKVIIEFQILGNITFGNKGSKISQITIIEPYVYIHRNKHGNWNLSSLFRKKRTKELPKILIKLKKGRLFIVDDCLKAKTTLSQIGFLYTKPSFYFTAATNSKQKNLQLSGFIRNLAPLDLSWRIWLDEKDISGYKSILKTENRTTGNYGQLFAGRLQAYLNGELVANTQNNLVVKINSGKLSIADGQAEIGSESIPTQNITSIAGSFNFSSKNRSKTQNTDSNQQSAISISWDSLNTKNLRFNWQGINFQTKAWMDTSISKEIELEIKTSKFRINSLKNVFPHAKGIDLESYAEFKGKIHPFSKDAELATSTITPNSFGICGQVKSLNTSQDISFPITADFKYQLGTSSDRGVLDLISVEIDKQTKVQGSLKFANNKINEIHLKTKMDNSRLSPFLCLFKQLPEMLKTNTIANGEAELNGHPDNLCYNGKLFIKAGEKEKQALLAMDFKGSSTGVTLTAKATQPSGGQLNLSVQKTKDLLMATSNLNRLLLYSHQISCQIEMVRSDTGSIKISKTLIDEEPYEPWQTEFSCKSKILNLCTTKKQPLTINGQISIDPSLRMDLVIEATNSKLLKLLDKETMNTFSGICYVKGNPFENIVITANPFKLFYAKDQSPFEGQFKVIKKKKQAKIDYLFLSQSPKNYLYLSGLYDIKDEKLKLDGYLRDIKFKQLLLNGGVKIEATGYKLQVTSPLTIDGRIYLEKGEINRDAISARNAIPFETGKVNFSYSPNRELLVKKLHASLFNHGEITASGRIPLDNENLAIDLEFALNKIDYQVLPDYFRNWQGRFNIEGKIKGDLNSPKIKATLISKDIQIKDQQIGEIKGLIVYENKQVQIERCSISENLTIQGKIYPEPAIEMRINQVDASLVACMIMLPQSQLRGDVNGQIEIKGTWNNPETKGTISLKEITHSGFSAERSEIRFNILNHRFEILSGYLEQHGGKLEIKRCYFQTNNTQGLVNIDTIADNFSIANLKIKGNLSFQGQGIPWTGMIGTLTSKNLLIDQTDIFSDFCTRIDYLPNRLIFIPGLSAKNSLSGQINLPSSKEIQVEHLTILQQQRAMASLNGKINFETKNINMDFTINNSDLRIIPLCFKDAYNAEGGQVNGSIQLTGTLDNPDFNGYLKIDGGKLNIYPIEDKLIDLKGDIRIVDNLFVTENYMEARAGKSRISIKSNGDFNLKKIDLTLRNEDKPLKVNLPGFLAGLININLRITGSIAEPKGEGRIELVNVKFTYPYKGEEISNKINWEGLEITIGKDVTYYNEYAQLNLKPEVSWLKIYSEGKDFNVKGFASAQHGGTINYLGQKFSISYASLEVREENVYPYLNALAQTRIGNRIILLSYEDYIGQSDPVLRATGGYPPLSEKDIVMLLIGGSTDINKTTEGELKTILRAGLSQVLGQGISTAVLSPVEQSISRLLNMDLEFSTPVIKNIITNWNNTNGKEPKDIDLLAESEIKVGKFLSSRLYVSWRGIFKSVQDEEFTRTRLRLKREIEAKYFLSDSASVKYKYIPKTAWNRNEYEIMIEKEVQF